MNKTKVSIDLWGTLIKASFDFKLNKIKIFKNSINYSIDDYDLEEALSQVKQQCNSIIESTGWQPHHYIIWSLLLTKLYPEKYIWRRDKQVFDITKEIDNLYEKYVELFLKHPPMFINQEIPLILEEMSKEFELQLTSNTMMIRGECLRTFLENSGIKKYFSKLNFSDELGVSKPHPMMFGNCKYHIGDNKLTDIAGAVYNNIIPIQVDNSASFADAYYRIKRMEKDGITKIRSA